MMTDKRILLHICCGPCGIYPLEKLRQDGFTVSGFFYNPNIQPADEYLKRRLSAQDFGRIYNAEVVFADQRDCDYADAIKGREVKPDRCLACWKLRLTETAKFAKANNFGCFTTTLLVSPYQDQQVLKELGDEVASGIGVEFHYEDFRPGFRKAHQEARAKGLYCQKYCGCSYSIPG